MRIGVLALQGDVAEHRAALTRLGVEAPPVRLPADLARLDGIVLPGGESTTMSMLLGSSGLLGPLGDAVNGGLPVFGTCAGLILLAAEVLDGRPDQRSFGAVDVVVRRNGYGRQLQSFECGLAVGGVTGGPVHAVFIRAPRIEAAGPRVEVLARLPGAAAAGAVAGATPAVPGDAPAGAGGTGAEGSPVLCRQGPVLVSTFHPELTGDTRVHELFVSIVAASGDAGSPSVPSVGATAIGGEQIPAGAGR